MSRRFTNLSLPNALRRFGDQTAHINGTSQYLEQILRAQQEIYFGIYDQLLTESYHDDPHNYLNIIELVG